jgi:16S rRNA (guanine(966)-N(2))-methyltransferase RsmD
LRRPKDERVRPTQDKVREAIFNILAEKIAGASVLDLYAGSGAFGIEAVSRGAKRATFVDTDGRCLAAIRGNLKTLEIPPDETRVLKSDAIKAIKRLSAEGERFHIVFLDPPYKMDMAKNCLITISKYDILATTCLIVAQHHRDERVTPEEIGLSLYKERRYGDTSISIFIRFPLTTKRGEGQGER